MSELRSRITLLGAGVISRDGRVAFAGRGLIAVFHAANEAAPNSEILVRLFDRKPNRAGYKAEEDGSSASYLLAKARMEAQDVQEKNKAKAKRTAKL